MNHPSLSALAFAVLLGISGVASAELVDRGGGLIYDTVLNITWLQDANYAQTSGYDTDGRMTWDEAMAWADQLVYGGYDDWRLPTALNRDHTGPCSGYNCTDSEMGYMFYKNLGATAGNLISKGTHTANLALFTHIQDDAYWLGTRYEPIALFAWYFLASSGYQYLDRRVYKSYAWAVRSGDITAASSAR
ncbi:MAG: DUF1566 domain-containing protein [Candidatus Competibacteraceae bacterium]|nr:DUF1566 domain-containing protein [Candidatus Competibacteraceae bacterium]MCP5124210.1 DUF1566 domain-containing protein [Gammaproteobacteria bacterium]HRX70191.1 DUF1566 domain-containing protein [Candidatus Competibacteraceae bacterium]